MDCGLLFHQALSNRNRCSNFQSLTYLTLQNQTMIFGVAYFITDLITITQKL